MSEELWIYEGNGRRRRGEEITCEYCGKTGVKRPGEVKKARKIGRPLCCSLACTKRARIKYVDLICAFCNKEYKKSESFLRNTPSKSGLRFCCKRCQDRAKAGKDRLLTLPHYGQDESQEYRATALRHYGQQCEVCKQQKLKNQFWETLPGVLNVHHIDGNRSNNEVENLMVICPCHHAALTYKLARLEKRKFKIV